MYNDYKYKNHDITGSVNMNYYGNKKHEKVGFFKPDDTYFPKWKMILSNQSVKTFYSLSGDAIAYLERDK